MSLTWCSDKNRVVYALNGKIQEIYMAIINTCKCDILINITGNNVINLNGYYSC